MGSDRDQDEVLVSNPSIQPTFAEVARARLSRGRLFAGGLAAAAGTFLLGASALTGPRTAGQRGRVERARPGRGKVGLLGFEAIEPSTADEVRVPRGYAAAPFIPWGDPIVPGGPAFAPDASNSAEDQARQFGMGHDGLHYFPLHRGAAGSRHGLLIVNHECTTDHLLFPDGEASWDHAKTRKSQHAHGVAVAEVAAEGGSWRVVASRRARRITVTTPISVAGPAAGHRLLATRADRAGTTVLGTVSNCAHGVTPWGTYLACEGNFHGYFWLGQDGQHTSETAPDLSDEQRELLARYGVAREGFGYRWATTDERFRADLHPHEPNRFGWMVEIDPIDPSEPVARPVKRTAVGRFKHASATATVGRGGRVVVYSGDDQRFEHLYKFVGSANWRSHLARGESPLDRGTLYVARFDADGTGVWLPLVHGQGPLTAANGFADQGEVVVKTRLAADLLGATRMDRPGWVTVHPGNGEVYCTLTNNSERSQSQADAVNPRGPNPWGHVVRWREARRDNAATEFDWDLFLLAGPGDGVDGSTIEAEDAFGSPDGLWFDPDGRLWIETDGRQPSESNNQILAADPASQGLRRFLTGVPDCAVTGVITTPDQRTMFANVQHPGDSGSPAHPAATSSWPDGGRPRPATVVVNRHDAGVIGAS